MSDLPATSHLRKHSGLATPGGLIIREREPVNFEYSFDGLNSFLTPAESFYIRSRFPAPAPDKNSYELRITGAVKTPLALRYDELRSLPSETRAATLECAGNSRVFLVPQVEGAQWAWGMPRGGSGSLHRWGTFLGHRRVP